VRAFKTLKAFLVFSNSSGSLFTALGIFSVMSFGDSASVLAIK
jgi:hypothetical protein